MSQHHTILVAPLNWGLGHATRCIPIIRALIAKGYQVIIGSDGAALELLRLEFPHLKAIAFPSYNIEYPENGARFRQKMVRHLPKIAKAIRAENKLLRSIIKEHNIHGVISDNRLGLYSSKVPTAIITHQLQVVSGKTTWLTSYLHTSFLKRFDECWVPDFKGEPNLSGRLGHPSKTSVNLKYIGPLCRMQKEVLPIKYQALVILSGPEPQRSIIENKLLIALREHKGKVLFVRGCVRNEQIQETKGTIKIVNFLTSKELEIAINSSEFVIARSGYTTIMDLAALKKKAFFIPTPGQPEQEYLAKSLKKKGIAPYATQEKFKVSDLAKIAVYKGFNIKESDQDLSQFFSLF